MIKHRCNGKFPQNSKSVCWISQWELACTLSWKAGLGLPRASLGVFRCKWLFVIPTLWVVEVTTSRSFSGQELGQVLRPLSAKLHGTGFAISTSSTHYRQENGISTDSTMDISLTSIMALPLWTLTLKSVSHNLAVGKNQAYTQYSLNQTLVVSHDLGLPTQ